MGGVVQTGLGITTSCGNSSGISPRWSSFPSSLAERETAPPRWMRP